jgi:hypothetical protein
MLASPALPPTGVMLPLPDAVRATSPMTKSPLAPQ